MKIGTLSETIEMIAKRYEDLVRNVSDYDSDITKYIVTNISEHIVMVSLASRINKKEPIENLLKDYMRNIPRTERDITLEDCFGSKDSTDFLRWVLEGVYRKIGLCCLASNNIYQGMVFLNWALDKVSEIDADKSRNLFLIKNSDNLSNMFKKAADLYEPVTESIERDVYILSRYDETLENNDARREPVKLLN